MRSPSCRPGRSCLISRNTCARLLVAASCGALLIPAAGCNTDEANRAFREAAAGSLQQGAISAFTGLVDGAFALWELGTQPAQNETPGTDDAGSSG